MAVEDDQKVCRGVWSGSWDSYIGCWKYLFFIAIKEIRHNDSEVIKRHWRQCPKVPPLTTRAFSPNKVAKIVDLPYYFIYFIIRRGNKNLENEIFRSLARQFILLRQAKCILYYSFHNFYFFYRMTNPFTRLISKGAP